jgi:hypothetical protein
MISVAGSAMLLPPLSKLVWNPCSDVGPVEVTNTGFLFYLIISCLMIGRSTLAKKERFYIKQKYLKIE